MPWLEPIPGPLPGGEAATFEPAYQSVRSEIEKLEAPAGGAVDWKGVTLNAGLLLQTKTKDLLLASVLAHALHVTAGAEGLATGVALLAEMLERYWDTMHPDVKRARARANSLSWFVDKTGIALARNPLHPPVDQAEALEVVAKKLAEVAAARLGKAAPSFGPLLDAVRGLKVAESPAPAPAPTPAAAAPASASAAPSAAGEAPQLASPADARQFLAGVGASLVEAARSLREASTTDATSYRILRVGLWLHLAAPPAATGGRTTVPPPPEALRDQLALLAHNRQWAALLEEAESALPRHRLALDLQRACWQALSGLGGAHERAREAVALEVRALLGRMPELAALSFADGTPLASAQTRAWIDEVVSPRPAEPPPAAVAEAGGLASRLAEVKRLLADGRAAEALGQVKDAVEASASGRERFLLRLELARACAAGGLTALAKGLFEELAREAAAHGLDAWEPRLATEALKGLIAAARALPNDPRAAVPQLSEHYRRLCSLDPAAAHEVWP